MNEEEKQAKAAFEWVITNKHKIIEMFTAEAEKVADMKLATVFMAGSPGAGKTEVSKQFIKRFGQKPIRIDADEIRSVCPGYLGQNSHIFQNVATKGVHFLYDYAISKKFNAILDGTFAYNGALNNIQRSIDHNRKTEIFFVYQDPVKAWDFTKKREEIECRKVSKGVFIDAFFKSRENVNNAKEKFGGNIELNLLIKDFEKNLERLELNVSNVDHFIEKDYTEDELIKLLK